MNVRTIQHAPVSEVKTPPLLAAKLKCTSVGAEQRLQTFARRSVPKQCHPALWREVWYSENQTLNSALHRQIATKQWKIGAKKVAAAVKPKAYNLFMMESACNRE